MRKYYQAALSYVVFGVLIVTLTVTLIPDMHYRSGIVPLLVGIAVLLALAYFVSRGIRWLVIVLSVLALARSCWWIYSFFEFAGEDTRWAYGINALLNLIVVYMLVRAAASNAE